MELVAEINKLLHRLGAKSGELAVTLMWDTVDDLDLHLELPNGHGEISAERPSVAGGHLDVDGNQCLERATTKPIENIYWAPYDPTTKDHPPMGEYTIWIKCFHRVQHLRDPNCTVVVTMSGKKEIFNVHFVAGCTEVKVATFRYHGPAEHDNGPRGSRSGRNGERDHRDHREHRDQHHDRHGRH